MRLSRCATTTILAILLGMTLRGPARAGSASQARVEGLALYRAGRFQEAIPYFDQVLARHGRDVEILVRRGACFLKTDQPERALADFDRVNVRTSGVSSRFLSGIDNLPLTTRIPVPLPDPDLADSWGNRGIALLMLGRNDEALQSFLRATALWDQPPNRLYEGGRSRAAAYQGLGQAYHRLGQDDLAAETYTEAISIFPTDANGFAGRAGVLESLKMFEPALADYSEAIHLDPAHARAYLGRGIVFSDLGRDELALADLDRALELDPKFVMALNHRGALHARHGRNETALADYDTIISLQPENAGAYKDRGGILVRMALFRRAVNDLDRAIQLDPGNAAAYQNRGAAFNGLGRFDRAVEDFSKAIELDPSNAGAHSNRGLSLFALGNYDQSVVDLSQAIHLAPTNAIPHFNRAEVFSRLGLNDRALADYDAALRLDPRMAAAVAASARIRDEQGQRDQAKRDYDMALQLDPKKVSLYHDRGNVRREEGDWRGALADYDRAIALDPSHAETFLARGWSRLATGTRGADYDARAYINLKGWRDRLSSYMAVLAVLGAREDKRSTDASRALDEALANISPSAWPAPFLLYLRGARSEADLLRAATSDKQQAEMHAFLGIDRLQAGDRTRALAHLRWARDHASPGSIAADLARAVLSRLPNER
jgi:tetratricopeptide (TPR) repeat protein